MAALEFSIPLQPPRVISPALRLQLLGLNFVTLIGGFFFAIGMLIAPVFALNTDPLGSLKLSYSSVTASGRLDAMEKTHFSEGGSENSDGNPIYCYKFTFTLPDGKKQKGESYAAENPQVSVGSPVTIEYHQADPRVARIQNTGTGVLPPWLLLLLIFPAIGLLTGYVGTRIGLHKIWLLREGQVAEARIVSCRDSIEGAPELPVPEFKQRQQASPGSALGKAAARAAGVSCKFTFTTSDGGVICAEGTVRAHEVEEQTLVFYDPLDAGRALLLQGTPAYFTSGGNLEAITSRSRLLWLVIFLYCGPVLAWAVYLIVR